MSHGSGSAAATVLALEAIVIGERVRKDLGDLDALARSMAEHGLLHPVVVTPDHRLVAGHRRIEAARRLGWTEIPVTVVSVEDLLSAERDENEVRKDFTPTEAVAIGRLIEAQHRAKIAARKPEQASKAGRVSAAKRSGLPTTTIKEEGVAPLGLTDVVASKAVGMSPATYFRAKQVVAAAEADPATFGDLPARMDETGQVLGAYTAMKARQGAPLSAKKPAPPSERLPINYRKRHVNPAEVVRKAVDALDGLCAGLRVIDPSQVDSPDAPRWAGQIAEYARELRAFGRRLSHG